MKAGSPKDGKKEKRIAFPSDTLQTYSIFVGEQESRTHSLCYFNLLFSFSFSSHYKQNNAFDVIALLSF